jgi:hypothetical protein
VDDADRRARKRVAQQRPATSPRRFSPLVRHFRVRYDPRCREFPAISVLVGERRFVEYRRAARPPADRGALLAIVAIIVVAMVVVGVICARPH